MTDTAETPTVHTVEVVRYDGPVIVTERVAVSAFIAGYTDPTRRSYATDLRIFAAWCHDHGINLLNVKRPHLETFARWMEQEGRMASTIGRRLSTLSSFYKYCQTEDILDKNPALNVRRPKVHDESRTLGLDRNELGADRFNQGSPVLMWRWCHFRGAHHAFAIAATCRWSLPQQPPSTRSSGSNGRSARNKPDDPLEPII